MKGFVSEFEKLAQINQDLKVAYWMEMEMVVRRI